MTATRSTRCMLELWLCTQRPLMIVPALLAAACCQILSGRRSDIRRSHRDFALCPGMIHDPRLPRPLLVAFDPNATHFFGRLVPSAFHRRHIATHASLRQSALCPSWRFAATKYCWYSTCLVGSTSDSLTSPCVSGMVAWLPRAYPLLWSGTVTPKIVCVAPSASA